MTVKTFPSSGNTLGYASLAACGAIQKVAISGTPTGGTFTLTYSGQTTTAIAYNATAYVVEQAVRALTNIGIGNVSVSGGPGPGTAWFINFMGSLDNQPITLMTGTASLTGGTSPALAVTTQQVGQRRPVDSDFGAVSVVFGVGAVQHVVGTPIWNVFTSFPVSIAGIRNPAPPLGQLWPRGTNTLNWPL